MLQLLAAMPGAIAQGLIWGVMAIGVYITYKVLDIADLTVDGSICTGAAVCTVLLLNGRSIWLAMLCAVLAGVLAGTVTGLLHVLLGIPPILAGILTQMVLWSVNLKILGKANQALPARSLKVLLSQMDVTGALPVLLAVCAVLCVLLVLFFGTELGCALRATGCNPVMSRAQGVNTQLMKVLGLERPDGRAAGRRGAGRGDLLHRVSGHHLRGLRYRSSENVLRHRGGGIPWRTVSEAGSKGAYPRRKGRQRPC